jgi:hypothetical protein
MNISETALITVPREFLVVVLAGFGNEFSNIFSGNWASKLNSVRVLFI